MNSHNLPVLSLQDEKRPYVPPVVQHLGDIVSNTFGASCGGDEGNGTYICIAMNNVPRWSTPTNRGH